MKRFKVLLFVLFLALADSPQYFWADFIAVDVLFRYGFYTLTLLLIAVIGFLIFKNNDHKWLVQLWTSFYLLTLWHVLMTGLYYAFAERIPGWDNTISFLRYFACSPFPFVALLMLSRLTSGNPSARQSKQTDSRATDRR